MITVSEESAVDFEKTWRIATEAFGSKEVCFSAPRTQWLYERGLRQDSAVGAAYDDDRENRPDRPCFTRRSIWTARP